MAITALSHLHSVQTSFAHLDLFYEDWVWTLGQDTQGRSEMCCVGCMLSLVILVLEGHPRHIKLENCSPYAVSPLKGHLGELHSVICFFTQQGFYLVTSYNSPDWCEWCWGGSSSQYVLPFTGAELFRALDHWSPSVRAALNEQWTIRKVCPCRAFTH